MKTLDDAVKIRNLLIQHLEEADSECAAEDRELLLTFVVAGGGFAGVETVAAINDFLREALLIYGNLTEEMLRVVLVHPGDYILPELGQKLGVYADKKLRERKVEIKSNCKVKSISGKEIKISDETSICADTLIWTAGTCANPLLSQINADKEHGLLKVNQFLQVEQLSGVWALGDNALVPDLTTGKFCPPTAQHASRQGSVLAKNIIAAVSDGKMIPFKFATLGMLASIGNRTGVARILGINFSGFLAWFLWRTIYLLKMPTLQKKIRVAFDWTIDLFFTKNVVQYMTAANAKELDARKSFVIVNDDCFHTAGAKTTS